MKYYLSARGKRVQIDKGRALIAAKHITNDMIELAALMRDLHAGSEFNSHGVVLSAEKKKEGKT